MNQVKKIAFSDILGKSVALTLDNVGLFFQLALVAVLGIIFLVMLPVLFFGLEGIRSVFAYSVGDIAVYIRPELPALKFVVMGVLYFALAWSLCIAFWAGCMRIAFDLIDHGTSSLGHVWIGDKKLIAYIGASSLLLLIVIPGLLLGVIPGIYALICFIFFAPFIIDRSMPAIGALKASLALTRGYRWQVLCWFTVEMILSTFFGAVLFPVFLITNVLLYRALLAAQQ